VVVRLERVSDSEVRVRIPEVDARYRGEADIMLARWNGEPVDVIVAL
jgi:hypothetical protein